LGDVTPASDIGQGTGRDTPRRFFGCGRMSAYVSSRGSMVDITLSL
jgi:hypothetical protein